MAIMSFNVFFNSGVQPSWAKSHRPWVYAGRYRITDVGTENEPEWNVGLFNTFESKQEAISAAYRMYVRDYYKKNPGEKPKHKHINDPW